MNERHALLVLAAATVLLAAPMRASAAVGDLSFGGCLANAAAQGCTDVPQAPLDQAFGLALRPDGRSVYVTSSSTNSISHLFATGPQGQLSWDGCLNSDASQGCSDLPQAPLSDPRGIAVSPDGTSVYVTSQASHSVAHLFATGPQGQISWDGCLNNVGSQGCGDLPAEPITGADGVAVSPNGQSLYVAAAGGDSVSHLFSTGAQGQISWDGCLNDDGSQNCGDLPQAPINGANGVAVSPDGSSVYVTSTDGASISHLFSTGAQGQISWDGCLNDDGSQNCGELPGSPLAGARGVAVSPDGDSVYVASAGSNSIAHFSTGVQGRLSYVGCLGNDSSHGCTDVPGAPLEGAKGVAVSPDGKSVYVVSFVGDSIAQFSAAGPQGRLSYVRCLNNLGSQNCGDLPAEPLDGANAVAVSPDGKSVYVTAHGSDAIVHFFRDLTGGPSPGPATPPAPTGGTTAAGFGSSTRVTLSLAATRIPARGPVPVRVTNRNVFRVTGTLSGKRGRAKLARKRFAVRARSRATVRLKLPRSLRRVLQRRRRLTLSLTAKDPAARTRTVKKRVTPRLKAKRRKGRR